MSCFVCFAWGIAPLHLSCWINVSRVVCSICLVFFWCVQGASEYLPLLFHILVVWVFSLLSLLVLLELITFLDHFNQLLFFVFICYFPIFNFISFYSNFYYFFPSSCFRLKVLSFIFFSWVIGNDTFSWYVLQSVRLPTWKLNN